MYGEKRQQDCIMCKFFHLNVYLKAKLGKPPHVKYAVLSLSLSHHIFARIQQRINSTTVLRGGSKRSSIVYMEIRLGHMIQKILSGDGIQSPTFGWDGIDGNTKKIYEKGERCDCRRGPCEEELLTLTFVPPS
jgi:hypothetical protein